MELRVEYGSIFNVIFIPPTQPIQMVECSKKDIVPAGFIDQNEPKLVDIGKDKETFTPINIYRKKASLSLT